MNHEVRNVLVTGGAGFIGSNFVEYLNKYSPDIEVVVVDKITYAGSLDNLEWLDCTFYQKDINDRDILDILLRHKIDTLVNFAAETHVDNSISDSSPFITTNINGTFELLKQSLKYWKYHPDFRFLHISTDEVYGSLFAGDPPSKEEDAYFPNSPYSASKASSDHLVRSYYKTYGLPVITSHCTNNFGPKQNEEKLIPKVIMNALRGQEIPLYGRGDNIRDWIYVEDHCEALMTILQYGQTGSTYNIGGGNQISNTMLIRMILTDLEGTYLHPNAVLGKLVKYVEDRPGHDFRYDLDCTKIREKLGWYPRHSFEKGLIKTIQHYYQQYVKGWAK